MLPQTTSAVSAFPEDDVGRPIQFASKTGVGSTGLSLYSNAPLLPSFLCLARREREARDGDSAPRGPFEGVPAPKSVCYVSIPLLFCKPLVGLCLA